VAITAPCGICGYIRGAGRIDLVRLDGVVYLVGEPMRVIAAHLAVISSNLTLALAILICIAMRVPAPKIPFIVFLGGDLIISALIWLIVFRVLAEEGKS
jgi:hypothetical protein